MKPFLLAVILLACVTSRACPQVGQSAATARPVAESRARAALALAFTVSPGFTAKRADVCRCGKQCPCCPGCWNRDAPSESCDCQPCQCCADCKGQKSAYYLAYHQAIAEQRGLLTFRPETDVGEVEAAFAYQLHRRTAHRENRVFVLVPSNDERVPLGQTRWAYDGGKLVMALAAFTAKQAEPAKGNCRCWDWDRDQDGRVIDPPKFHRGPCQNCACNYGACMFDGKPHEKSHGVDADAEEPVETGWRWEGRDDGDALYYGSQLVGWWDGARYYVNTPGGFIVARPPWQLPAAVPVYRPAVFQSSARFVRRGGGC